MTIVEQSVCLLSHYYHIVSKKELFCLQKVKKSTAELAEEIEEKGNSEYKK